MILFPVLILLVSQPPVNELLSHLDELYRSEDSHSVMTMEVVTQHWERTLEMEAWSSGEDKTFILVHSPAREAGSATLRIGTEMWNYSPATNSTVRIPPSMMTGSWMGSHLTNNDIVKEITYSEDYTGDYMDTPSSGEAEDGMLYLALYPEPSTAVVWSRIECAVNRETLLPQWERYYDARDRLIKTITFSEVREMGGRTIPSVMRIQPGDEEEGSTTVTWEEAVFDAGVSEDVFSLANLQSGGGM
jgi:hypothetical protein